MRGETSKQRLETIEAPYNRMVWLDEVTFDSGMRLLRVTIREGRRITQLDVDPATAASWGEAMLTWSRSAVADEPA